MKRIQSYMLSAAGYTVLILFLFYAFTSISGFAEAKIGFGMFGLIMLFGALISFANTLLYIDKLTSLVRIIIHYCSLLVAFCVIFIGSGNISAQGAAAIFVAVIIFTVLYAAIFAIAYFSKKGISKLDSALDKKNPSSTGKAKKSDYKPLYK